MVGVISNIAALSAKTNLNQASSDSQSSIYRLSSGKAIAQSSDNVAGLAIGTILQTNVSTLKTSLSNTAQATSLLGVADGALANIGDILQRQKSLATQAISGSLTDSARSFLNQEFQSLKSEVDRISSTTNFNGIKLIDGSLYAPNTVQTYTRSNSTFGSGQLVQVAPMAAGSTLQFLNPAWGNFVFTYDTTANIAAATAGAPDKALLYIDVTQNTTVASQMNVLYNNIQNILNYGGTNGTIVFDKGTLASTATFSSDSATYLNISSIFAGSMSNSISFTSSSAGTFQMNGSAMAAATAKSITANTTQAVNGDLNAGFFGGTTTFSGSSTTTATGSIGDSILSSLTTTAPSTTGIYAGFVCNNPGFVGTIQGFTATYQGANVVTAKINIGGIDYVANSLNTNGSNGQRIAFASSTGGAFKLKFNANMTVSNQADANTFAARLNQAFSGVTFMQNRIMSNFTAAGTVYGTPGAAATGDLAKSQINIIHSNFNNMQVQNVTVTPPVLGGTISTIAIQINGETYVSGYNFDGSVATAGLDGATSGTTITKGHTIGLVSTTNPNHIIQFLYGGGGATNLDISTTANAAAFQIALSRALGINSGNNIGFQVGTTASDTIGVQIQAASSSSIYLDNIGTSQGSVIAIDSISNAILASSILDNAINNITAIRANVGALESRFNYASSNLITSIQNQDSARSTFLDTNITVESTNFAQSQVKVQTALSVLAQANQLPESLLKLIGG